MDSALPSNTATLRPMTSSSINSLISLPTAIVSILNTTNANTTCGHSYKTTTDCSRDTMSTWIHISYMLLSIALFIHFLISRFELSKPKTQISIPKYGNIKQEKEGLSHEHAVRSQIWEEKENYQKDASRMVKIRTLAQDSSNAIDPESKVHFMTEYAAAKKNEHLMLIEEILENYRVLPSEIEEVMEEGRYQPVPRYRAEDHDTWA
ncbi:hypothetical protein EAF04_007832 [Stromatinia cepivora]|nr:hypothetical protein EAF04_007832 [Stromatinia cepivora]